MSNHSKQSPEAAELRQDSGPDPIDWEQRFWHRICAEHHQKSQGVLCPVCQVIEEKDKQIARLLEKIDQLKGTIDALQNRSPGW
jgi:hypothetical protein